MWSFILVLVCYQHTKFHVIPLNGYGEMPSKRYAVCVMTFTMPAHLHGAYFVSFVLLTGRCYDAETSVILLLLDRAFS